MGDAEVLILHGAPGSGKSTLARAVTELLREADAAHAVIDLDELSIVHPDPGRWFARENLRAIWPNYAAVPGLKVLMPAVLADEQELRLLRGALARARLTVCELTAPVEILKERVTAREPNEHWQQRLRHFVDLYAGRDDLARLRDFTVSTHDRSTDAAAREIVQRAGWSDVR